MTLTFCLVQPPQWLGACLAHRGTHSICIRLSNKPLLEPYGNTQILLLSWCSILIKWATFFPPFIQLFLSIPHPLYLFLQDPLPFAFLTECFLGTKHCVQILETNQQNTTVLPSEHRELWEQGRETRAVWLRFHSVVKDGVLLGHIAGAPIPYWGLQGRLCRNHLK